MIFNWLNTVKKFSVNFLLRKNLCVIVRILHQTTVEVKNYSDDSVFTCISFFWTTMEQCWLQMCLVLSLTEATEYQRCHVGASGTTVCSPLQGSVSLSTWKINLHCCIQLFLSMMDFSLSRGVLFRHTYRVGQQQTQAFGELGAARWSNERRKRFFRICFFFSRYSLFFPVFLSVYTCIGTFMTPQASPPKIQNFIL